MGASSSTESAWGHFYYQVYIRTVVLRHLRPAYAFCAASREKSKQLQRWRKKWAKNAANASKKGDQGPASVTDMAKKNTSTYTYVRSFP